MREILFRGQIRRRGEKRNMKDEPLPGVWVYGGVLQGIGDFSIIYGCENKDGYDGEIQKYPVYTNTLGQYTGLKDRNEKKIFEGDIVEGYDFNAEDGYGLVRWRAGAFEVVADYDSGTFQEDYLGTGFKVIGNAIDNPELLEENDNG